MRYSVFLHPDVVNYLDSLSQSERKKCYKGLIKLAEDPYKARSGCNIKKMKGRKTFYRLRVGNNRFLYVVSDNEIFVEEAFKRGRDY
ncbi:MAG: type II toxin-antitoxin system RelE/ParE family toxin [Thermoplasmata archaeon]|nr:MAG: type II toxin-antitoxin system RelE/ParE family toxin [Thermoplasmata archaeon]